MTNPRSVVSAWLNQVETWPEKIAIESCYGATTYQELEHISRGIAAELVKHGIHATSRVLLISERNQALVFALLACLRLQATFIIADMAYPAGRIEIMLEECQPDIIVICGQSSPPTALLDMLQRYSDTPLFNVPADGDDALKRFAVDQADILLDQAPDDAALAYISFTSGSTGRPKAIGTGYAALPHFVAWHIKQHQITPEDRFSMISGLSHDPLLRDIFTPLMVGAVLCIPSQSILFDPDELAHWFKLHKISICHLTPALGEIIATGAEPDHIQLDTLRYLFFGGDVLNKNLLDRFEHIAPHATAVNFYGATETPQAMAFHTIVRSTEKVPYPLGRGMDDTTLFIVRQDGYLAQQGETGEIWIQTQYLSQGYLNDPQLTHQKFVAAPADCVTKGRCYRTGDLGVINEQGEILFKGRVDHQIKIRGFRVEPGEISRQIEACPGVMRAFVLPRDEAHGKVLVAYITSANKQENDIQTIRQQLETTLPCYMVPSYFVVLDKFPLFPNGKIDIGSLPNPSRSITIPMDDQGPISESELALLTVWREALQMPHINVNDSFLSLGGDSLTALKVMSRMKRMGIPLATARGIFQGKTVRQIVNAHQGQTIADATSHIAPEHRTNMALNCLRALLLIIVITDHWINGVTERLLGVEASNQLVHALMPILNIATPGFSFVFGIGIGYIYFTKYQSSPRQTIKGLHSAGFIVLGGVVAMGLLNVAAAPESIAWGSTAFFNAFYGALLFYAAALFSIPWWFKTVTLNRHIYRNISILLLAFIGAYSLCRITLLDHEQTGLMQLIRLLLVAKFSYFSMGACSLLGMLCGIYLREHPLDNLRNQSFITGSLFTLIAMVLLYSYTDRPWAALINNADMRLWRWILDIGIVLVIASLLITLYRAYESLPKFLSMPLQLLPALGLATFPLFVLHSLVIPAKEVLVHVGMSTTIALSLCMAIFLTVLLVLTRRLHQLYFATTDG